MFTIWSLKHCEVLIAFDTCCPPRPLPPRLCSVATHCRPTYPFLLPGPPLCTVSLRGARGAGHLPAAGQRDARYVCAQHHSPHRGQAQGEEKGRAGGVTLYNPRLVTLYDQQSTHSPIFPIPIIHSIDSIHCIPSASISTYCTGPTRDPHLCSYLQPQRQSHLESKWCSVPLLPGVHTLKSHTSHPPLCQEFEARNAKKVVSEANYYQASKAYVQEL